MNLDQLDSVRRLIHHWASNKHLLAATVLCALLSVLALFPKAENADATPSTRSHITGITAATNTHSQTEELAQVLEQTRLALNAAPSPLLPLYPLPVPDRNDVEATTVAQISLNTQALTVQDGDNLSLLFNRAGLSARDVYMVANSDSDTEVLNRLFPGYQLTFGIDDEQVLQTLEVMTSPLESYHFTRNDDGTYSGRHEIQEPEIQLAFKETAISDSLFLSAQRGGISAAITMKLAGIFGGVIDFLQDTRSGDTLNVLYETQYLHGERIGDGAIVAAQFTNQGKTFTALRYTDRNGETGYYSPDGESMHKAFLRNPVDFVRISSDFNPNRRHPIQNTIRAHKGTDYAAPTGTPVVATANGRVTWAAPNGSFGNLVVIKHDDRFETKYAHLSRYARGVSEGARVHQGQVIGYVGATGGATGPHLHYEFLMDGVHRNPRTIIDSLPKSVAIADADMPHFRQQTQQVVAQLSRYAKDLSTLAHLQEAE